MGSEDSEDPDLNDDYDSKDSFLVLDSGDISNVDDDDDEEDIERVSRRANKRRRSRILVESSTDESSNMENMEGDSSNDFVPVSMQLVESVIVLGGIGNNAPEENIVEGKTFATTYLIPEKDEEQTGTRTEKSTEKEVVKTVSIEQPATEENKQIANENLNDGQTSAVGDKAESNLTEKPESVTDTVTVPQNITQPTETDTNEVKDIAPASQKSASDVVESDSTDKEPFKQKILAKKQRFSLSGIDPMSKESSNTAKKANRKSLGDLNPNHQQLRGDMLDSKPLVKSKSVSSKTKLIEKDDTDSAPPTKRMNIESDEPESNMNASTSSIENMSPNHSKAAPLNISSQGEEENNNRKNSAKKCKQRTAPVLFCFD